MGLITRSISVQLQFNKDLPPSPTSLGEVLRELTVCIEKLKEIGISGNISNLSYNEFEPYVNKDCECECQNAGDE